MADKKKTYYEIIKGLLKLFDKHHVGVSWRKLA